MAGRYTKTAMARIWKVSLRSKNAKFTSLGSPEWRDEHWGTTLAPKYVYYVDVCNFVFTFYDLERLRETLAFYELKIHPSSRQAPPAEYRGVWRERDVYERWWERLPVRLQQNNKRPKVVKALREALEEFSDTSKVDP
jgi:hypothetical protein